MVLKDISINIAEKTFACILGPSGCGKTTLLNIIAGFIHVDSGAIILNNKDITQDSPSKRNIGIVFQNYALFPNLTAYKNIAFALTNKKLSKKAKKEKVESIILKLGLETHAHKYPYQLSGGQQQRVALARSLILSPKLLLLDEPLSALDAIVREQLRQELKEIHNEFNITTIMVTHDQEEALTMSDQIVVMDHGTIQQIGTPKNIYEKPVNTFVANFIGKINHIEIDNNYIYIRPEHIIIKKSEPHSIKFQAKIEAIDYLASFYRLTCYSQSQKIVIDLTSLDMERYRLKKEDIINIELPEKYRLKL